MAGYSGTPLAHKLGIKDHDRVGVLGDPSHFASIVAPLPDGAELVNNPRAACDLFVVFVPNRRHLENRLEKVIPIMPADSAVWVSWPKRTSGVDTDVTEDVVREFALPRRLVDVKVCAFDDTRSGLKLVVRREHRVSWPG